ncbi:MAG: hypothetical protein ACRDY7_16975 [Acidimicrobiia bacterium]
MKPRVLFVGATADARSVMAAAFLDHLAGDRYTGVAVTRADLTAAAARSARRVVVIGGSGETQPAVPGLRAPHEKWGIPVAEGRPAAEARVIRDTTRRLVERLIARLDTESIVR